MAVEANMSVADNSERKRQFGRSKGSKGTKGRKLKPRPGNHDKVKINSQMKKLFRKRARDYNSDGDEDEDKNGSAHVVEDGKAFRAGKMQSESVAFSDDEFEEDGQDKDSDGEGSDREEGDEIQPGVTKFMEGCRAFKMAFNTIIKNSKADDALGPVLSAHKQLVAQKLAEEDSERKVKGEAKKEKHLISEKGHVKPANYLDSNEKFLIGVATKGVVKLFNAVNKAQHAQKGLDPSRFRDAKAIKKRRKEAFFSALGKKSSKSSDTFIEGHKSSRSADDDDEGPGWAPLRDSYMLTNPKLKDWDKNQDTTDADDIRGMSEDGSSDEE